MPDSDNDSPLQKAMGNGDSPLERNNFSLPVNAHNALDRLRHALHRVCRVCVSVGERYVSCGTGFLIGPNHVLTNYHVVEHFIENKHWNWSRVRLEFDFAHEGAAVRRAKLETGKEYTCIAVTACTTMILIRISIRVLGQMTHWTMRFSTLRKKSAMNSLCRSEISLAGGSR